MPDFGFGLLQSISLSIFPLMATGLVMFVGFLIWHFYYHFCTKHTQVNITPKEIRVNEIQWNLPIATPLNLRHSRLVPIFCYLSVLKTFR